MIQASTSTSDPEGKSKRELVAMATRPPDPDGPPYHEGNDTPDIPIGPPPDDIPYHEGNDTPDIPIGPPNTDPVIDDPGIDTPD